MENSGAGGAGICSWHKGILGVVVSFTVSVVASLVTLEAMYGKQKRSDCHLQSHPEVQYGGDGVKRVIKQEKER